MMPEYVSSRYAAAVQRHLRTLLPPDSYHFAMRAALDLFNEMYPQPKAKIVQRRRPTKDVIPPRPQYRHEEREFTFACDGTTKRSCPVEGCRYGMPSSNGSWVKRHSDGSRFAIPTVEPEMDEFDRLPYVEATADHEGVQEVDDEQHPDDPVELTTEPVIQPLADRDDLEDADLEETAEAPEIEEGVVPDEEVFA